MHRSRRDSGAFYGFGQLILPTVNALSDKFSVRICRSHDVYEACFRDGKLTAPFALKFGLPAERLDEANCIEFKLSSLFFDNRAFDFAVLALDLEKLSAANPGAVIYLRDWRQLPTQTWEFRTAL